MASFYSTQPMKDLDLAGKLGDQRIPWTFELEVTARCNNNCRHCYNNLPASDSDAIRKELSIGEIEAIADQAVALGSLWCVMTGGEPLIRNDFPDIYVMLKKKGFLISILTNACLVTREHVDLFRRYPPEDIEVTVYGITPDVYETVTRTSGAYDAFRRGLDRMLEAELKVRLKAMAIRSNVHELSAIASFCRQFTCDYFRFDPLLHLRSDGDPRRNEDIRGERLSPADIVAIEKNDNERFTALLKEKQANKVKTINSACNHLFQCGVGNGGFTVGFDGAFRLCADLCHPACVYDLRQGTLAEAWNEFTPSVLEMTSTSIDFLEKCRVCSISNLCLWCPAHAYLETGELDDWVEYFCQVAHARARALGLLSE